MGGPTVSVTCKDSEGETLNEKQISTTAFSLNPAAQTPKDTLAINSALDIIKSCRENPDAVLSLSRKTSFGTTFDLSDENENSKFVKNLAVMAQQNRSSAAVMAGYANRTERAAAFTASAHLEDLAKNHRVDSQAFDQKAKAISEFVEQVTKK